MPSASPAHAIGNVKKKKEKNILTPISAHAPINIYAHVCVDVVCILTHSNACVSAYSYMYVFKSRYYTSPWEDAGEWQPYALRWIHNIAICECRQDGPRRCKRREREGKGKRERLKAHVNNSHILFFFFSDRKRFTHGQETEKSIVESRRMSLSLCY